MLRSLVLCRLLFLRVLISYSEKAFHQDSAKIQPRLGQLRSIWNLHTVLTYRDISNSPHKSFSGTSGRTFDLPRSSKVTRANFLCAHILAHPAEIGAGNDF